jgi:polyhydroxyalkanoate synthesis repressor PhaR
MAEPRVIKKYPNRRLYDTVESRYITLADIRKLVNDKVEFIVVDKKTDEDITRSILLQVIAEQETGGESIMSQDFLAQMIRAYGGTMPTMVGDYLEQSLKLFTAHQNQVRDRVRSMVGLDPMTAMSSMAQENFQRWSQMQETFLKSMVGAAAPRRDEPGDPKP